MDISDGITLGAVVVALVIGVSSIIQTQRLQRRERRERLLNEIIQWAIDVDICLLELDHITLALKLDTWFGKSTLPDLLSRFKMALERSKYITKIAYHSEHTLYNAVEEVKAEIDKCANLLLGEIVNLELGSGVIDADKLDKYDYKPLTESVNKVIEEATKIKTRDIS